jgi:hypothetical protein
MKQTDSGRLSRFQFGSGSIQEERANLFLSIVSRFSGHIKRNVKLEKFGDNEKAGYFALQPSQIVDDQVVER